jgi:hypothetical protein
MALIKQGTFTFLHINQSDTPQPGLATPAGFKAMLDSQANELKTVLNANVDALTSTTNGSSNIGSPPIVTGGSTNVMGQLQYLKDNMDLKETIDSITVNRKLSAIGDFTGTIQGTASATISASSAEVTGARGGFASLNLRLNGLVTTTGSFTGTVSGVAASTVATVTNEVITARSGYANLDARLAQVTTDIGTKETSATLTSSRKLSTTGDFTGTINGVAASTIVSGSTQGNTMAANIGTMANLHTTDKSSLVNAVNEVKNEADEILGSTIGTMSQLATSDKGSLVGAINEIFYTTQRAQSGSQAVAVGVTQVTITCPQDMAGNYAVTAMASWSTNVWYTNKSVIDGSANSSFILHFSAAPSGGGTVDWIACLS